jgi:hypothetical protein
MRHVVPGTWQGDQCGTNLVSKVQIAVSQAHVLPILVCQVQARIVGVARPGRHPD